MSSKPVLTEYLCNATAKVGPSNLWSELSPVSMMERWHFDAKLQEFLNSEDDDDRDESFIRQQLELYNVSNKDDTRQGWNCRSDIDFN